jgi:hypothetical protein
MYCYVSILIKYLCRYTHKNHLPNDDARSAKTPANAGLQLGCLDCRALIDDALAVISAIYSTKSTHFAYAEFRILLVLEDDQHEY